MSQFRIISVLAAIGAAAAGSPAFAQHDGHEQGHHPARDAQPQQHGADGQSAEHGPEHSQARRPTDPYPLPMCPVSGQALGSMGDPLVRQYDGREVRFCCAGCIETFEAAREDYWKKIDEQITKDQRPLYPLKTSVVTGEDLPDEPYEFVYGARLVRLGAESERVSFVNHAEKFMADLDTAVIAEQGEDYPLTTCAVSKEEFGGDMGEPVDLVVAGRLIRLCCNGCKADVKKEPAKFIAMVDAARNGDKAEPDADHKDDHGHGGG